MKSFIGCFIGLMLSVSVGAEPVLEGHVRLSSGEPVAGVQVRLFDLADLRRSVGTTTDAVGYFALSLQTFPTGTALPDGFVLGQNYPNPFNPSTIIPYQIPASGHVRLEVFNVLGQRVATLVDAERSAGFHSVQWDATDAAGRAVGAGVYIYQLRGSGVSVSRRMVLVDGQAGMPAAGATTQGLMRTMESSVAADSPVYGLTVSGGDLVAYVNPTFRVGIDEVDIVVEEHGGKPRMKLAAGGILGDVNNDGQVDAFDVLYVALYSEDPSITLPNNGDISLGDVNGDGTVNLVDALLLATYLVDPSNPSLPAGIGQGGGTPPDGVIPPPSIVRFQWDRSISQNRIFWDPSPGATVYEVYWDGAAFFAPRCGEFGIFAELTCKRVGSVSTTSFEHHSSSNFDGYWIRACNSAGCSALSSPADWGPPLIVEMATAARAEHLDGSVVLLRLIGLTYEQSISTIRDSVQVSGIPGVTVSSVSRLSDTEVQLELAFDGRDLSDLLVRVLSFSVTAGAIANYNGSALVQQADTRPPINASYVRDGTTIRITWDAVSGAEYYKIYHDDFFRNECRLSLNGRPMFCEELASNIQETSYVHTSPDDDNNYYWVVACNSGGCSDIDRENPAVSRSRN